LSGNPPERYPEWDQATIDGLVSRYNRAKDGREVIAEEICWMTRRKIIMNLRRVLRDDIALDEAEFAAIRELKRRLKNGVGYIRKRLIGYVTDTAIRFVVKRRTRLVSMDEEGSRAANTATSENNPEEKAAGYADLYGCLARLESDERKILELHDVTGLSLQEIAEEIGTSYDAMRKRHSRIINKMKKCITEHRRRGVVNA